MKIHKKSLLISVILISVLFVGIILLSKHSKWVGIYNIKYFSNLKEETVTEICLLNTFDSAYGVVFTDEDLISEWQDFLADVEIRKYLVPPIFRERIDGGHPTVIITTEKSTYTFSFHYANEFQIKFAGKVYLIKNPESIPFSKTYDEAATRHGTISFW